MTGLQVRIDRDSCIGAGTCVRIAPQAFSLDDEGIAVVSAAAQDLPEEVRMAEGRCPSAAIELTAGGDPEEGPR